MILPAGSSETLFINNLKFYGITHTRVIDLITPDMLTPEEIKLARYRIPESEAMRVKNKDWLKEVHKRDYKNQKYLEDTNKVSLYFMA